MKGRKGLTSIGELCRFELNLMKVCGGLLFDEHHNWYLSLAYKILITILSICFAPSSILVYDRIRVESKSAQQNINFFWTFQRLASAFALLSSSISSIRFNRLMSVVLRKRFDTRYFANLAHSSPVECMTKLVSDRGDKCTAAQEASATDSEKAWHEKVVGRNKSDANTFLILSKGQCGENMARLNLNFHQSSLSVSNRWSRVRLARILLVWYLIFAALVATLRLDYEQYYTKTQSSEEPKPIKGLLPRTTDAGFELPPGVNESSSLRNTARIGLPKDEKLARNLPRDLPTKATVAETSDSFHQYVENTRQILARGLRRVLQLVRMWPRMLINLLAVCLIYFQLYGQTITILLITSTLADLLSRVREQELSMNSDIGSSAMSRRQESPMETRRASHQIGLKTTDLLIQVRDVLVALRIAARLDYLFIQVLDMSIQMGLFSLFVAFIAGNQYGWIGLLALDYWNLFLGTLLTRLGYVWLHAEVRKISLIEERRLIIHALDAHNVNAAGRRPDSAHSDSTNKSSSASLSSCSPLITSSSSACSSNQKPGSRMAPAFRQMSPKLSLSTRMARVRANTNYRLAHEIEQLWPTDWFKPDVKSYVSQNVFVITFVATLQQLVEASAKLQLQAQRNGIDLLASTNRTASL